jgi:hypothetical protein
MLRCLDHPNVALPDWRRFRAEYKPRLIEQVIDRGEARLPAWFMPLARGVAIASDTLLRKAGYRDGMHISAAWRETSRAYYILPLDGVHPLNSRQFLLVRASDGTDLWTVERHSGTSQYEVDEVLVSTFGSTPLFARSCQSAMLLADYCHKNAPPPGFQWVKGMPDDPTEAMAAARQRQIDETKLSSSRTSKNRLN